MAMATTTSVTLFDPIAEEDPTLKTKEEDPLEDTALAYTSVVEDIKKGKLQEAHEEEEVGSTVEAKVVKKLVDDGKSKVVEEKKSEPEGEQEEVGYKGKDASELGEEKEAEDMESPSEDFVDKRTEIKNDVALGDINVKHVESTSEASIMVSSQSLLCCYINVDHSRKATNPNYAPI